MCWAALEGADLTLAHLPEEEKDAKDVLSVILSKTKNARKVQLFGADLTNEEAARQLVEKHLSFHGHLDSLCVALQNAHICHLSKCAHCRILNHGTQSASTSLSELSTEQWHKTFDTNIHSFFYLTKAALPHLQKSLTTQPTIVFNASVNQAVGHPELVDYSATKGAIVAFSRALSNQVVGEMGIRINCE